MQPNPLKWMYFDKIGYRPRVGQMAYHRAADTCRYLSAFAYPRAGKSRMAAAEVGATWWQTDCRNWIVAPKYGLGAKEFAFIWEDHSQHMHARRSLLDNATRAVFNAQDGDMEIRYPWGWYVQVRTADNPMDLLGEELNHLILAEGAQLGAAVWPRFLQTRLAKRQGQPHVPTTPKGMNWLYDTFYVPGRRHLDGRPNPRYHARYWSAVISHLEGVGDIYQPGVYAKAEIEHARLTQPADVFLEQFGGAFTSYAGMVWANLHRRRHSAPARPIPPDWELVVGLDFGAGTPTVTLFGAWDQQRPRHLWLWHVARASNQPIQWAKRQLDLGLAGRRPGGGVGDPAAKQSRLELQWLGYATVIPYTRQFQDGFDAVDTLMATGRLHVLDTPALEAFWTETARYQWKETATGTKLAGQTQGPYDISDCLRYLALMAPSEVPEAAPADPLDGTPWGLSENEKTVWRNWERLAERASQAYQAARSGWDDADEEPFVEEASVPVQAGW